jgi:hypothetical protein
LSTLSFHISKGDLGIYYSPLATAVYFALASKFMAESARDVGKSTFVSILDAQGAKTVQFVSDAGIEAIRKIWNKHGAPRFPKRLVNDAVPKLIYSAEGENKVMSNHTQKPRQRASRTSELES